MSIWLAVDAYGLWLLQQHSVCLHKIHSRHMHCCIYSTNYVSFSCLSSHCVAYIYIYGVHAILQQTPCPFIFNFRLPFRRDWTKTFRLYNVFRIIYETTKGKCSFFGLLVPAIIEKKTRQPKSNLIWSNYNVCAFSRTAKIDCLYNVQHAYAYLTGTRLAYTCTTVYGSSRSTVQNIDIV